MSQVKMGERFGVPRERIGRLVAKAIKNLQHESRSRRIKPLFYTYEEMRDEIIRRDERIIQLENDLLQSIRENAELRRKSRGLSETPAAEKMSNKFTTQEILGLGIEEMGLSTRSYNCLRYAKISTVADLLKCSRLEVRLFRGLGEKSFEEVEQTLENLGFRLKDW